MSSQKINKNSNFSRNSLSKYYMYGKHPVLAALENPNRKIEKVLCTQKFFDLHAKKILTHRHDIVNENILDKLIGKNPHQGIIAHTQSIFLDSISSMISPKNSKLVILDGITDPQNVGSIIRNAAALGIDGVILPKNGSPDENGTVAKSASGSLEIIPIAKVTNIARTIELLKSSGFWIIGFDTKSDKHATSEILSGKVAMIFGSEDDGLRRLTSQNCDLLVKIPINSMTESLNVANATAIAFYLARASSTFK
jgi:23S rRNA (guanosine2251-2'-O)-methyltransferase